MNTARCIEILTQFKKRLHMYNPNTHNKVHVFFVLVNVRPHTANIVKQFLAKSGWVGGCKLDFQHTRSQYFRLLPVPTTQTRFERRFDDIPNIQRNVTKILNSSQKKTSYKVSSTCIADLSGA
ncbi:hypothetical protein TNCV_795531 [Trichonephila clavipes]|nr:hypothetical protein TNCV_795531 [Trichonephila clavipes]